MFAALHQVTQETSPTPAWQNGSSTGPTDDFARRLSVALAARDDARTAPDQDALRPSPLQAHPDPDPALFLASQAAVIQSNLTAQAKAIDALPPDEAKKQRDAMLLTGMAFQASVAASQGNAPACLTFQLMMGQQMTAMGLLQPPVPPTSGQQAAPVASKGASSAALIVKPRPSAPLAPAGLNVGIAQSATAASTAASNASTASAASATLADQLLSNANAAASGTAQASNAALPASLTVQASNAALPESLTNRVGSGTPAASSVAEGSQAVASSWESEGGAAASTAAGSGHGDGASLASSSGAGA